MKQLRLQTVKASGDMIVDEKDIVVEEPAYWKQFHGKTFSSMVDHFSQFGKTAIYYTMNKEIIYEHTGHSKRLDGTQKGNRFGKDKFGKSGRTGNRTPEPVKEKLRVIVRRADKPGAGQNRQGDYQRGLFD
jgi:hypothetical protein